MIKFEHNNGDLKCAIFGGSVSDLCADLSLEMSLIYGSMVNQDKNLAEEFRRNMMMSMLDREISDKIFSTELFDAISKADTHAIGSVKIDNKEEFERQLKELLKEVEDE